MTSSGVVAKAYMSLEQILILPALLKNKGLIIYKWIFFLFREEESIQLDGLNASQIKQLREKSEKFVFQAEVNRMMKLIINSLYKNKEVSLNILF